MKKILLMSSCLISGLAFAQADTPAANAEKSMPVTDKKPVVLVVDKEELKTAMEKGEMPKVEALDIGELFGHVVGGIGSILK